MKISGSAMMLPHNHMKQCAYVRYKINKDRDKLKRKMSGSAMTLSHNPTDQCAFVQ